MRNALHPYPWTCPNLDRTRMAVEPIHPLCHNGYYSLGHASAVGDSSRCVMYVLYCAVQSCSVLCLPKLYNSKADQTVAAGAGRQAGRGGGQ
jgi:hypothetical protein